MYPEKSKCSKNIVHAHSIQKKQSLDKIAINGHLYRFEIDSNSFKDWKEFKTIMPEKVGINKLSTFNGFCAFHDNELFQPIDDFTIEPTKKQSLLLSIRSMANEIYIKTCLKDLPNIGKEVQEGANAIKQAQVEEIMQLHNAGTIIGLLDLADDYENLFTILKTKEYNRVNRLVIEIDETPEVMCSGCWSPTFDMDGNILQDLGSSESLETITFEVLSTNGKGIINLCWYDKALSCSAFAKSLMKIDDIPNAIVRIIFGLFENHAFKIDWFDSLSVLKRKGIMKLVMDNVMNNSSYFILNDRKKYVNWNIKSIVFEE